MKVCDYCRKEARVEQNNENLCLRHHDLAEVDEPEAKTEKKEVKDDYILL